MILLVGASASGKTEIAKYLAKSHGIKKAITHTTRKMREGERQDVDYHFVDEATFQRMLKEDKFVEHTCYNGNHYGCSKDEIADDKCVILDPEGLKSFLALNNQSLVSFYLYASKETRKARMQGRGDDPKAIESRLANDEIAFNEDNLAPVNYKINCDEGDVATLAEKILKLYKDKLSSI